MTGRARRGGQTKIILLVLSPSEQFACLSLADDLQVHGINVDEANFHFVEDPAGYKGRRDKKLIELLEKYKRKERLKELRKKFEPGNNEPSMHMKWFGSTILDALNGILEEEITYV